MVDYDKLGEVIDGYGGLSWTGQVMEATVETPRVSGPFRLGRPVTLTLIEHPINDEDRQILTNYGAAAVLARRRQTKDGGDPTQTDEGAVLKEFADGLRKRLGVQWTRPAFLPRM